MEANTRPVRFGDGAWIVEGLEVHVLGALDLHEAAHAAARLYVLEGHRRDLDAVVDLDGLGVEWQQPDGV